MWTDNDTPGCIYDTSDCTGNCCEHGRIIYEQYLKDKYGETSTDEDDETEDE